MAPPLPSLPWYHLLVRAALVVATYLLSTFCFSAGGREMITFNVMDVLKR